MAISEDGLEISMESALALTTNTWPYTPKFLPL